MKISLALLLGATAATSSYATAKETEVRPVIAKPALPTTTPAAHAIQQAHVAAGDRWYLSAGQNDYDELKASLKSFVNLAQNQHTLHRQSKNPTVQKVQQQLSSLASQTNVIKVPFVMASDVKTAVGYVIPKPSQGPIMDEINSNFFGANHTPTDWYEAVDARTTSSPGASDTNVTDFSYASVWLYPSNTSASGEVTAVDMFLCALDQQMSLEDLDLTFSTHTFPNGTSSTKVKAANVPKDMTKDDIQQFATQLKYLAADSAIHGLSAEYTGNDLTVNDLRYLPATPARWPGSLHMRAYDFREELYERQGGRPVTSDIGNFANLAKSAAQTLVHAVASGGGFIHSTTETEQIISSGGYTNLSTSSNNLMVPQVSIKDVPTMINMVLAEFPQSDIDRAKDYIDTLLLSHSTDMNASWYQMDTKFNSSDLNHTGGHGFGGIFTVHMTPNATGLYHDFNWVVYDATFSLADRLMLITDTSSWLGGLFKSQTVDVRHLPPVWTGDDETAMKNFLQATMDYIVCCGDNPSGPCPCKAPPMPNP